VIRRGWTGVAASVLATLWPVLARACATCNGASDRNRSAFFWTTVFLSLLPLGLFALGFLWWTRGGREWLAREFDDRDAYTPPVIEGTPPAPPGRS